MSYTLPQVLLVGGTGNLLEVRSQLGSRLLKGQTSWNLIGEKSLEHYWSICHADMKKINLE